MLLVVAHRVGRTQGAAPLVSQRKMLPGEADALLAADRAPDGAVGAALGDLHVRLTQRALEQHLEGVLEVVMD